MDYGFDRAGAPVDSDAEDCYCVLGKAYGRPLLYLKTQAIEAGSMYSFGALACSAIRSGFSWDGLLEVLPDPKTPEKEELRAKLLDPQQWRKNEEFVCEEINVEGFSPDDYEAIVEIFSRLYPAYGHFIDSHSFLSDNFYSFDPSWPHRDFHSAPTFRSLVEEAFGSYRKDLARATATSSGSIIALLSSFKDSVNAESLIDILRSAQEETHAGWGIHGSSLDRALQDLSDFNRLSPALRTKLVRDLLALLQGNGEGTDDFATLSIIEDSLAMLRGIPTQDLRRFRSDRGWDQFHSRAIDLAPDDALNCLDPLSIPSAIQRLDCQQLSAGAVLKLLRTPHEYALAGSKDGLKNCMGKSGYYTKAKRGESYCLVADSPSGLIAAIELQEHEGSWRILQLRGYSNQSFDGEDTMEEELLVLLNGELRNEDRRSKGQNIEELVGLIERATIRERRRVPEVALRV